MKQNTLQFGSLSDMVGVELRYAQIAAERTFLSVVEENILPGHFTVLMLIRNNPGQNQTALAKAAHLDRSTMVPIIDHCERKGWVERKANANDRRAYAIHLTSKGGQLMSKLEKRIEILEKKILDGLGEKNRNQLMSLLKQLQRVFSSDTIFSSDTKETQS
jgi:DNA-binding MarR family transcriptional regulator